MLEIRKVLIYLSVKYKGEWEEIMRALEEKERCDEIEVEKTFQSINSKVVTLIDEDYPESLKNIYKPPFVLYYYGDLSLINDISKMQVAIVGSRDCSEYGTKATQKIVGDLKNTNAVIISGLAKGIDYVAHSSALKNNLKTVAVLGTGIERVYPHENVFLYEEIKKEGLIISEYASSLITKDAFPKRNRIIAGLAKKVIVTEAKQRSGTLITLNYALEQGKDVYVVPCSIFMDSCCDEMIKEGAILLKNGKDIF